jgi:signal transduction histidine kinase
VGCHHTPLVRLTHCGRRAAGSTMLGMSRSQWVRRRTWRDAQVGALVLFGLVLFVLFAYVVIVVGGGALFGHVSSPQLGLSVLATAVVALAFDPVQRRLEVVASGMVDGGRPAPYEVLRRFSETVSGSYPAEQLPARMARVLADGTGAEWAQVWVTTGGGPTLAASWPPRATASAEAPKALPERSVRSMDVRHAGELLGLLVVKPRDGVALTSVEERLFAGLAAQAGLVLRSTALRLQLGQRLTQLAARAEELNASRQRVLDAQDEARRLLERDIHDGAQQHLVALAVNLRLAHTLSQTWTDEVDARLTTLGRAADEAISTLRQLSQGIYPAQLTEGGLTAALRSALSSSAVPVVIDATGVGRYPRDVETAAYFSTLEAVQNAAKHSAASVVNLSLLGEPDHVSIVIQDDGTGFLQSDVAEGSGLVHMRDRVESVGGTVTVGSEIGTGTRVCVRLPALARGVAPALDA